MKLDRCLLWLQAAGMDLGVNSSGLGVCLYKHWLGPHCTCIHLYPLIWCHQSTTFVYQSDSHCILRNYSNYNTHKALSKAPVKRVKLMKAIYQMSQSGAVIPYNSDPCLWCHGARLQYSVGIYLTVCIAWRMRIKFLILVREHCQIWRDYESENIHDWFHKEVKCLENCPVAVLVVRD